MQYIGLCGPEGAGKSTAAKILSRAFVLPVVPFAAPLKRMLEALAVPHDCLYGAPADKARSLALFGGKSARYAMQTLGTEWGRDHFGSDFWVRAWEQQVGAGAVADDVRFANEAFAIMNRGGVVIRVIKSKAQVYREPAHKSEDFAAVPYTIEVVNDSTPDVFAQRLLQAIEDHAATASKLAAAARRLEQLALPW